MSQLNPADEYLIFGYIRKCKDLLHRDFYSDITMTIAFLSMMYYRLETFGVPNLKIGDRIKMAGKKATVKFIGETKFYKGELIGVELDEIVDKGCDGTFQGQKYFEAADKTGLFTRRTNIESIIYDEKYKDIITPKVYQKLSALYNLCPLYIGQKVCFVGEEKRVGIIKDICYKGNEEEIRVGMKVVSENNQPLMFYDCLTIRDEIKSAETKNKE